MAKRAWLLVIVGALGVWVAWQQSRPVAPASLLQWTNVVALVSPPSGLDWDELDSELHPSQFTIESMPSRLARLGDLFRGTLTDKQELMPAIEALQKTFLDSEI